MSTLPHHVLTGPDPGLRQADYVADKTKEEEAAKSGGAVRARCPAYLTIGLGIALVLTGVWCLVLAWGVFTFCGRLFS